MNNCFFKRFFIVLALLLIIFSCSKSNEEVINDSVRKMKPGLPLKTHEYVTWIDVKPGQDEIIYLYEIHGIDQTKIDKDTMIPKLKSSMILYLKSQKDSERLFKRNISLKFVFQNEAGDELFNCNISREDLGY
jgi:hypothetical protein